MARGQRPDPKLSLTKEARERLIPEIKHYFLEEREIEIGDLAATLILDFFVERIASEFYNQGVYDSHKFMLDRVQDLLALEK